MVGIFLGGLSKAKALQMLEAIGPAEGERLPTSPKSCGHVLESGPEAHSPPRGHFSASGGSGPMCQQPCTAARGPESL